MTGKARAYSRSAWNEVETCYRQHTALEDEVGVTLDVEVTTGQTDEGEIEPKCRLDGSGWQGESPPRRLGRCRADCRNCLYGLLLRTVKALSSCAGREPSTAINSADTRFFLLTWLHLKPPPGQQIWAATTT
jgi:hypothetical protein